MHTSDLMLRRTDGRGNAVPADGARWEGKRARGTFGFRPGGPGLGNEPRRPCRNEARAIVSRFGKLAAGVRGRGPGIVKGGEQRAECVNPGVATRAANRQGRVTPLAPCRERQAAVSPASGPEAVSVAWPGRGSSGGAREATLRGPSGNRRSEGWAGSPRSNWRCLNAAGGPDRPTRPTDRPTASLYSGAERSASC